MKEKLKPLLGLVLKFFLPAYLLFVIFTFPTNDLRHLISSKIAQATKNKVQVHFQKIDLNVIPKPSLYLEKVRIDSQQLNQLKMANLAISPSIIGLITFKPGVSLSSSDLFKGQLDASIRAGAKTSKDVVKQVVDLQIEDLQLRELLTFLQKSLPIDTALSLNLKGDVDPSFQEGINAEIQMNTKTVSVRPLSIPSDLGSIDIPKIQISGINLDATMKKSDLKITKGNIGKAGDTLYGNVQGDAKLKLLSTPAGPKLASASYDLVLDMSIQNQFLDQLAFKPIIENYLSPKNARESTLRLRISASRLGAPPNIRKIQ